MSSDKNKWDGTERRENGMFTRDFYDKMIEMHSDMKHIVKWAESHDASDKEIHEKLNTRVKSLEENQARVIGGAGVLGAITGYLTHWFHK